MQEEQPAGREADVTSLEGPGSSTEGVRVRLLGPLRIETADGSTALSGTLQRLVLALLCARANQVVPSEELIDVLWGADGPDDPNQALQVHISKLRRFLDSHEIDARIDHEGRGYVLRIDPEALDVRRFEGLVDAGSAAEDSRESAELLRDALALWRGDPLGELGDHPTVRAEVTRLEELRLRASEARIEADLELGRHDEVVPELRHLTDAHPLRERFWELLMVALYRSGRQAEALEVFDGARRMLRDELGVDPSRSLRELHEAILRQDPGLEAPADRPPGSADRSPPPARRNEISSDELAGRVEELARLDALLEHALSGDARTVLIGGGAGIGKSRLLGALATRAKKLDASVLIGRCIDLGDSALPFAPIVQTLRLAIRGSDGSDVLQPLGDRLAPIVPELADIEPGPLDLGGPKRGHLLAAIHDSFVALARHQPLLLAFEDLHWADPSTRDAVTFLARNLADEPLLFVNTFRTDELHRRHPLRSMLGELTRLPEVTRMDLPPLSVTEVAVQLRAILEDEPDPHLTNEIQRLSSGNPFFVEELLASYMESGLPAVSAALHDVVGARLDRLPDTTRRVLEVCAVAGETIAHGLLDETIRETDGLLDALRTALDHHVLVADGDKYRFRHALVREVVLDELVPGDRTALHRRVAECIELHPTLAEGGSEHIEAQLAHHWFSAHDTARAFEASLRAAREARSRGAFAEALRHYERSLELWDQVDPTAPDRVDVLEHAAAAARASGRYRRAIPLLRAALHRMDDDKVREANVRRALALNHWSGASGHDTAKDEIARAHRLVAELPDSLPKAQVVHTHAQLQMMSHSDEAIDLAREAVRIATAVDDQLSEAHARVTLGTSLVNRGEVEAGREQLDASLELAQRLRDPEILVRAYNNLVLLLCDVADTEPENVVGLVEDVLTMWDTSNLRGESHAYLLGTLAHAATVQLGDWQRAESVLARMSRQHLEGHDLGYLLARRGMLRWMQGRLDDARVEARQLHELDIEGPWYSGMAHTLDALVGGAEGDVDAVRAAVDAGRRVLSAYGHAQDPVVMELRLVRPLVSSEVDAALGAPNEEHLHHARAVANSMRRRLAEQPPRSPGPRQLAELYLALADAEVSRATGPDPATWRRLWEETSHPYWRIYARWRLGESLLEAGESDLGGSHLAASHAEATERGARGLAAAIEELAEQQDVDLGGEVGERARNHHESHATGEGKAGERVPRQR